jgi:hypothetical protein
MRTPFLKCKVIPRDYADEIVDLKGALEEEQTTKEYLEENFALGFSKIKKSHDRAFEVANNIDNRYDRLVVSHDTLSKSHEQLKALYLKEHTKLSSTLGTNNDACTTNSISYETSILEENVELRAQLDLLTSNYGKLVESHGNISSSHRDILASHDRINLAHDDIYNIIKTTNNQC